MPMKHISHCRHKCCFGTWIIPSRLSSFCCWNSFSVPGFIMQMMFWHQALTPWEYTILAVKWWKKNPSNGLLMRRKLVVIIVNVRAFSSYGKENNGSKLLHGWHEISSSAFFNQELPNIVFNHPTNCCTSVHTHEDCLWLVEEEKKHQYQQSFFLFMVRWRPHLHSQLQKSLNWHIKHVPTSSRHNLSPLNPLFDMINSKTQKSYCFDHICGKWTKSEGIWSLHACMLSLTLFACSPLPSDLTFFLEEEIRLDCLW